MDKETSKRKENLITKEFEDIHGGLDVILDLLLNNVDTKGMYMSLGFYNYKDESFDTKYCISVSKENTFIDIKQMYFRVETSAIEGGEIGKVKVENVPVDIAMKENRPDGEEFYEYLKSIITDKIHPVIGTMNLGKLPKKMGYFFKLEASLTYENEVLGTIGEFLEMNPLMSFMKTYKRTIEKVNPAAYTDDIFGTIRIDGLETIDLCILIRLPDKSISQFNVIVSLDPKINHYLYKDYDSMTPKLTYNIITINKPTDEILVSPSKMHKLNQRNISTLNSYCDHDMRQNLEAQVSELIDDLKRLFDNLGVDSEMMIKMSCDLVYNSKIELGYVDLNDDQEEEYEEED